MRPVGEQSAFIGGLAAACAGMHAALSAEPGAVIDVSIHEALATMAATELARAGLGGRIWSRRRLTDGNGATVTILPARDGYAAISPREDRQWAAWLEVMGSPDWTSDPRFARKPDRVANWDALHALMSAWSRRYGKQSIADMAQAAHVPSFPLREPAEQLNSAQLAHRNFWRPFDIGGQTIQAPGPPFGLRITPAERKDSRPCGPMPLSGIRVLDFSWVIAGPTATRYLAAMGAEVIKIEAPGRGDPGRTSELHTVLGQAKRSVVLDLKKKEAVAVARELAAKSDVLIENFATGVMDRLGLGAEALRAAQSRSDLCLGIRPRPHRARGARRRLRHLVAMLCRVRRAQPASRYRAADRLCVARPDVRPDARLYCCCRTLAPAADRRRGAGRFLNDRGDAVDDGRTIAGGAASKPRRSRKGTTPTATFRTASTAAPAKTTGSALPSRPTKNGAGYAPSSRPYPRWRAWGFENALSNGPQSIEALTAWSRPQSASAAATELLKAGIPAAALATSRDLVDSDHLRERGFWEAHGTGVLPGLPWRASFGRTSGGAPELGADTDAVLRNVLDLSADQIAALRQSGALG